MYRIAPINAFNDNYIWLITHEQNDHVFVVDPGDANAVITYLNQHKMSLTGIFITHHHADHTGGIAQLQQHYGNSLTVYGPDNENITGLTHPISPSTQSISVPFEPTPIKVIHLPGHTLGHIAYFFAGHLFCGDTLFSGGCGRLFEGTPEQMLASLNLLASLDTNTLVYPAHEYTLANLAFAQAVDSDNHALSQYTKAAQQLRAQDKPTLPTSIGLERSINPFLRADNKAIQASVARHSQQAIDSTQRCFTLLRQWKDKF
ncbi:hydroxyacylglutathione hydrolase [Shewanella colwelliana]|uniref:Hydroxyacylglutathione hydrolase n=1 Tax=Shewanella colwelliana TaxID=23 RepID=A0A1E5IZ82_SHECO|nr:hydroxyacylglutathione hydrolase [Shewanella colwelliana]OEG75826.1 hydroxyacylglutathione hydrolase [Shewanella colwelliana]